MSRLSRTQLLARHDRDTRLPRPSDGRDWVPGAALNLTPALAELNGRSGVAVTRAFAGTLR